MATDTGPAAETGARVCSEMARRGLPDTAEREARWQRAVMSWENIPKAASTAEAGARIDDLLRRGSTTFHVNGHDVGKGEGRVGQAFQSDRRAPTGWKG